MVDTSDKKRDLSNFIYMCGCGNGIMSHAEHGLCESCTAQEIVSESIEAWMVRVGEDERYSLRGLNLFAASEFDLRMLLMPVVLAYIEMLPPELYPILKAKHTLPRHNRAKFRE